MVLAVIGAAACGSSQPPGQASPPTTSPAKLSLAATAGAKPSADSGAAAIYPFRPTRYVLDGTLPDLGATAPVRKMNSHQVSAADVQRFADALGLVGTPAATAAGWELETSDAFLNVDNSSGIVSVSYGVGAPGSVGGSSGAGVGSVSSGAATPPDVVTIEPAPDATTPIDTTPADTTPVDVPNAADAQSIAQALLDRMGVLAGQDWSVAVSDSGSIAIACAVGTPCPTVPPEVSARTVTFSLVVDKKTVAGLDWSVTIGEHRRIESVGGQWATPEIVGSYPLRSTATAFAELQDGTAQYPGPQPMAADSGVAGSETAVGAPESTPTTASTPSTTPPEVVVHISGVSLGVARWDAGEVGGSVVDLVPTYTFHAVVDEGTPYDIEVLALDPSAVTFVKPVPAPEPKPLPPEPQPQPVEPQPQPVEPQPVEPQPAAKPG